MKKKQKQPKKINQNSIVARYLMHTGYEKFKYITVYKDYSLSIGCEQKLSELTAPIPLLVKVEK